MSYTGRPTSACSAAEYGGHVRTFEDNRADVRVTRHELAARIEDVLPRSCDIHVLLLGFDQHAEKLAAVFGADNRRIERYAHRFQVRRRKRRAAHRYDADDLPGRQR